MAGPERINPNAAQWSGKGAEAQRDVKKDEASVESSKAGAESSRVSAAKGAAELPYVGRKAKAEAEKAEAEAAKAKRDKENAEKGRFLEGDDLKSLEALVDAIDPVRGTRTSFKPGYSGTFFDWPTQLESYVQKGVPSVGTPGQSTWWQRMKRLDMIERNKYFGASLTGGEKSAWDATTVSPGMDPKKIEENLKMREDIVARALHRKVNYLRASGYREDQIGAILGPYAKEYAPGATAPKFLSKETPLVLDLPTGTEAPTTGAVAGESVKGPRFTPEVEGEIIDYVRSPGFTPEGYGQLVAQKALEAGLITEDQVPEYTSRTTEAAKARFEGVTPETRARTPGYVDYSDVDKQAMENAGLGEVALQALKNIPESGVQLAEGLLSPATDLLKSALEGERVGLYKTVPDIAVEVAKEAVGGKRGETTDAMLTALSERYGDPKRLIATDPLGAMADASVVLGGAGAAARLGRMGRAGDVLTTASRAIDPVRVGTSLPNDLQALKAKYPRAASAAGTVAGAPGTALRYSLGLSSGVPGGEGYARALRAGFERGESGAPTPRSEAFTSAMRGKDDGASVVAQAEEAIRQMQRDASDAYRSGYVDVQNDATILDFADIDKALDDLSGMAYYKGEVRDQSAAKALEDIRAEVESWKQLDPAEFHTPEGMDALKQRVYGIADKYGADNDRRASAVAKGLYHSIKDTIAKQVPSYAATMKAYSEAQDLLNEVKSSFSLNDRAGMDTKLRKLQSVMRNNASTDYGYRRNLADLAASRGQSQTLIDSLAGHSVSSPQPRGLGTIFAGGAATSGMGGILANAFTGGVPMLDPAMLAALPLTSPRLLGEVSYGLGRAAGTAKRGISSATRAAAAQPQAQKLADLHQKYPTAFLGAAQASERSDEADALKAAIGKLRLPVFEE